MAHKWFETVEVARQRAQKLLPPSVYGALKAGSEAGETLDDNLAAFRELGFAPLVAGKPAERDQSVSVLGQQLSMPVFISPTGVQMVHPEAELGMARATAARGTAMSVSNLGSTPIEQVVEANPQTFFQMYWAGSRDEIAGRVDRAKRAGVAGLILTLDWSFSHGRDWGSPSIPDQIDAKTAIKFFPELATHPVYSLRYAKLVAKTRELPDLSVPNFVPEGERAPGFFEAYGSWMGTPPPTWDDLAWIVEQWGGPFMLKGIMRPDDARRAVDAGFSTISVSNHGGNNLDTTPAAIRALPLVVDAVGDQIEVVMDSGIRRGSDVVKALALGARATMVGRASLFSLAIGGQAGVENLFDVLRNGIDSGLLGLGKASVADLSPADILIPEGFSRNLPGAS